jgi:hypothetical protein
MRLVLLKKPLFHRSRNASQRLLVTDCYAQELC